MKYVIPEMEIVEFDESVLTEMTNSGVFDNKNETDFSGNGDNIGNI